MSHDHNFKNLILDYPHQAIAFFAAVEAQAIFPKRALRAVLDWLDLHQPELMENWQAAQQRRPLKAIAPLE